MTAEQVREQLTEEECKYLDTIAIEIEPYPSDTKIADLLEHHAEILARLAHERKRGKEAVELLKKLSDLVEIQCSDGNWNYDGYMHGMTNGMILAEAIMKNEEPKYLDAPKEWLRDKKGADHDTD